MKLKIYFTFFRNYCAFIEELIQEVQLPEKTIYPMKQTDDP